MIELTILQLIGLIIGVGILASLVGFFLAACCTAASRADDLTRRDWLDEGS